MKKIISFVILSIALLALAFYWWSNQPAEVVVEPRVVNEVAGVKIIAFGDSLTAGYSLPASESYPAQLEATLKAQGLNVQIINSGVSGETTRGNLERAEFIRKQNPDIVLLGIGGNDALRLLPVEETKSNIEATIDILKSGTNPPEVILLRMQAPINVGLEYKRAFDTLYEDVASTKNITLLPFITNEVFLNRDFKLADGIHLNQAGYAEVIKLYLGGPVAELVKEVGG